MSPAIRRRWNGVAPVATFTASVESWSHRKSPAKAMRRPSCRHANQWRISRPHSEPDRSPTIRASSDESQRLRFHDPRSHATSPRPDWAGYFQAPAAVCRSADRHPIAPNRLQIATPPGEAPGPGEIDAELTWPLGDPLHRVIGKPCHGSTEHASGDRNQVGSMPLKMELHGSIFQRNLSRRQRIRFESSGNLRQFRCARGPRIQLLQKSRGGNGTAQNSLQAIDIQICGMQRKRPRTWGLRSRTRCFPANASIKRNMCVAARQPIPFHSRVGQIHLRACDLNCSGK